MMFNVDSKNICTTINYIHIYLNKVDKKISIKIVNEDVAILIIILTKPGIFLILS
jgi:hypothetical protein